MEVNVKVNVEIGESTKEFISGLVTTILCGQQTAQQVQQPKKKAKKEVEAQVKEPEVKEEPQAKEPEVKEEPQAKEPEVKEEKKAALKPEDYDALRKEIHKMVLSLQGEDVPAAVADNCVAQIKAELTKLGVGRISHVKDEDLVDFRMFISNLLDGAKTAEA